MTEPTAPTLPADAPPDVKAFFECTGDTLVWRPGPVTWLGLPSSPDVAFAPGAGAGTVDINVSLMGGLVGFTLPATVNAAGELVVDTSSVPDLSGAGLGGPQDIDRSIDNLNAWFRKNGKKLDQPELRDGAVALRKSPLVAAAPPPVAGVPVAPAAGVPVAPVAPVTPTPPQPPLPGPAGGEPAPPGRGGFCSLLGVLLAVLLVAVIGAAAWVALNVLAPASTSPAASPTSTATAAVVVTATPTAAATTSPTAAATPTATATPTPVAATATPSVPISQRTDFFNVLIALGALSSDRVVDYMDDYQTDPQGDHSHATGEAPGFTPPFGDIRGHVGFSWTIDGPTAQTLSDAFRCVNPDGLPYRVQCLDTGRIAPGTWVFVNVMSHGALPQSFDGSALANLAVVFDDDGDPMTGYRPDPAFPGDSFTGSTRWFEQFHFGTASQCFATDATLLNDDGFPERNNVMSRGRFVTWHANSQGVAEYVLMVPADEVGGWYRAVIVGTQDGATYAPDVTSHDYSEADEPFSFHMLETY